MAAVKKSDLEAWLSATQKKEADEFEMRVNSELNDNWAPGEEVLVTVPRMNKRSLEEVITRFRVAGWDVRTEHDQREGDSIVLS